MRTVKEEQLQKEVEIWKSRAEAHEENYLRMLKRIDQIAAERELWKLEATRWRDMYLEYDEMLECQVQEAVDRLNKVWEDLDKLKKKVQNDLRED
jgi:predicted  nucleic acid-binding Zn-ribbon protein